VQSLKVDTQSVFINCPFSKGYQPIFLSIVAALVSLGLKPRSVLEVAEQGQGRMRRLFDLMSSCGASIHDLSSVGTPARFNMPFELGIAYSFSQLFEPSHRFVCFERKEHRMLKTLSDLRMVDPKIHCGSPQKALECVYDTFSVGSHPPPVRRGRKIYRGLRKCAESPDSISSIFSRLGFKGVVQEAVALNEAFKASKKK